MKLFLAFLLIFFQISFRAFASSDLDNLSKKESELKFRIDYNSYLALEYLQYSRNLENQKLSEESSYFAIKGLRASNNYEIYPEVPENWKLDPTKVEEAVEARERLQLLINPKTKQTLPIQLAHLMMLYDCWLTNEQREWNLTGLVKCKTRFLKLADETERFMKNLKEKPTETTNAVEEEPELQKFSIFFDFNSHKLNSDANEELLDLIDYLKSLNGNFRILLTGNSDREGKEIYNDVLSRKRVLVVQDRLLKNGVPADLIAIGSTGENNPEIITENGQQSRYNRLVRVYVLKGKDSISDIPLPLIDNYIYKKEIQGLKKNKGLTPSNE